MATFSTNEFKGGLKIMLDGDPYTIVENEFVKPGKGQAFNRVKVRNLKTGRVIERTFKSGETVEAADVLETNMQYLYKDGDDYVFMDVKSYEQTYVPSATVGDAATFMLENQDVIVAFHEDAVLFVELPASVVLTISHTEPGLQGDRSSAGTKPATVETGAEIQVPLFLNTGDKVKVDTRSGSYISRVTD